MGLITLDLAFDILQDIAYQYEKDSKIIGLFFEHSYMTARTAQQIAEKLKINSREIAIAGLFHDIGKCLSEDKAYRNFHEIVGAEYFKREGVKLGITDSQEQCERIAQTIRPHFVVYEQFLSAEENPEDYQEHLLLLKNVNSALLLPSSWNEAVIIYADLTNRGLKIMPFEETLQELEEKDQKNGNPRLKAIMKAKPRLLQIKEDIETALQKGWADSAKYVLL